MISDITKVTIGGGLLGSPLAKLTQSQDSNILAMLKKAQYKGTDTAVSDGYPPVLVIVMPKGHIITISPVVELQKRGNSETGLRLKDYVDFFDSNDKSHKLQRLYAPDLYDFLYNWQQEIPKSQWQTND